MYNEHIGIFWRNITNMTEMSQKSKFSKKKVEKIASVNIKAEADSNSKKHVLTRKTKDEKIRYIFMY